MPPGAELGMKSFFEPKSVAVAGVSTDPDKLGSIIFANMTENSEKGLLKARVYALNPAHERIGSHPCYSSFEALPETPELLIVAVPESQTVDLVRRAAGVGVKAVVMITGGFAEVGKADVEEKISGLARRHGMRVLGPNTIGLVDTWSGVDSLFLRPTKRLASGEEIVSMLEPLRGEIAVITQSGHLGEVIAEELASKGVGVRAIVGTGNQLDVSVEDVIQYFSGDENTKVIAVYLEGVRDGRRFMAAASVAARKKPIVVFKVGKTTAGARAALTHTASLVGDYEVYQAAFRQSGVIEARTISELVDYSIALRMLPRVAGNRLLIVTNAGGVGAIAADEAGRLGLKVQPPTPRAKRRFELQFKDTGFASNASLSNPIDLTASVTSEEFVGALELFVNLPEYDLALVMPTHHAPGMAPDIAKRLSEVFLRSGKPVACSVIGDSPLAGRLQAEFMARDIPSFQSPEEGVGALAAAASYERLRTTAAAPGSPRRKNRRRFDGPGQLSQKALGELLRSNRIPQPRSAVVKSAKDFVGLRGLRFPVACKLLSRDLPHKSDLGGVVLGVPDGSEVKDVFARFSRLAAKRKVRFEGMLVQEMAKNGIEVILGALRDPTFGPVVMVGLGGTYTELLHDFTLAVAPISPPEARRLLTGRRIEQIFKGYRGGPSADIERVSKVVSAFSYMMVDNPEIEQVEVNPLIVSGSSVLAVDVRAVVSTH